MNGVDIIDSWVTGMVVMVLIFTLFMVVYFMLQGILFLTNHPKAVVGLSLALLLPFAIGTLVGKVADWVES